MAGVALALGTPQTYRNIAVIPLTDGDGGGPSDTSLSEALEARSVSVPPSLPNSAACRSDQADVWDLVSGLREAGGAPAATAAMRDVYRAD